MPLPSMPAMLYCDFHSWEMLADPANVINDNEQHLVNLCQGTSLPPSYQHYGIITWAFRGFPATKLSSLQGNVHKDSPLLHSTQRKLIVPHSYINHSSRNCLQEVLDFYSSRERIMTVLPQQCQLRLGMTLDRGTCWLERVSLPFPKFQVSCIRSVRHTPQATCCCDIYI